MRSAIITLAFIGTTMGTVVGEENDVKFVNWISKHGRSFQSVEEYNFRRELWLKKDEWINNFYATKHSENFEVGHNKFSDWTKDEFKKMLGINPRGLTNTTIQPNNPTNLLPLPVPVSLDWRMQRKVTPVKDQASCGSCWSFATVASLEGAHAIKTGQLLSFSEQQFVSCVTAEYGCLGCGGGEVWGAYAYWIATQNYLVLEANYRYDASNSTCVYEGKGHTRIGVQNYYTVPQNNSAQLMQYMSHGPVALYISASEPVFSNYQSGIIDSTACNGAIDHGVTGVGFGVSPTGVKYWIVKNSWNTSWGENGYVRIKNSDDMTSGFCMINSSPYAALTFTDESQ